MTNNVFGDFQQTAENTMKKFMMTGMIVMALMILGAIALAIGRKEDIKAFKIAGVVLIIAAFAVFVGVAFSSFTGLFSFFKF